jgi:hypothetical protein|tara:strand:+ start:36 stop:1283 length:1248 start_codon:yes stop_codon:yes gene_type:complete
MDKELYDLKNWAIETLKEYKAELLVRKQVTGKPPSALKKVDRFLNALAVDTSGTYADMIDDARRKGLSQKELANMGRNLEERIMNSFRVLPDDPAHHMYSLRTAGDLVQNVEPGVREMGLQILKDEGYILGNVRQNLTSLAEATHQGRTGRGAELAALGEVNVDKTQTAIAHPRGTGDPLISSTIDYKNIKTPEDFANAYRPLLEQQKADITAALETEAPRRKIITEFVEEQGGPTDIFSLERSQAEVKAGKDIITQAPGVMQRAYRAIPLVQNGSFRLSFGFDDFVDAVKKNLPGAFMGAAAAIEPEAVTAALQGDVTQAAKATAAGAGFGAAVQQTLTKAPVLDKARAVSVLGRAPGLLKFGGAAARILSGPVGIGYTGLELIDAGAKGITGKGIFEPSDKPVTEEDLDFATL